MIADSSNIIQENAWNSSGSTSQRMKQATSKVFLGDESKLIYIVTEFHASDEVLLGPEIFMIISSLHHNYLIITRK